MKSRSPDVLDYCLLLGLALIFGNSFVFTAIALSDIPPITLAFGRLILAAACMVCLMKIWRQRLPALGKTWIYVIAAAFFGYAFPFALVSWGQVRVDAGLAAIFMAVMPLITVVLAHLTTSDEKLNWYTSVGVVFGLVGVIVLMGWDKLGGVGDDMLRQYAILLAAVCYAINAIVTKKLVHVERVPMMVVLLFVSAFMLLPFSVGFEQPWQVQLTTKSLGSLFALALGPTALATLIILTLIDRQGASFLSQINFLVPLAGVFFGWLFLSELLPPNAWFALAIILVGIALSRRGSA